MRLVLHIPHPLAPGLPRMLTLSLAAHATALLAILLFPVLGPRPAAPAWDDVLVGALIPDLPAGAAAGAPASSTPTETPPSPAEAAPPAPADPEPPPPPEEPAKRPPPRREQPPPAPPKPVPVAAARPTEVTESGGAAVRDGTASGVSPGVEGAAAGAGGGSGSVGAAFDVGAFPFAYYRAVLETKLQSAWQRPMYPPGAEEPIPVSVRFRIRRDGSVHEVVVEAPSPIPALDASALRAVYSAAPFPPLPAQFTADSLGVSIRFTLAP